MHWQEEYYQFLENFHRQELLFEYKVMHCLKFLFFRDLPLLYKIFLHFSIDKLD